MVATRSALNGKNYFGDMGQWSLDDETHPSYINMQLTDVFGTPLDSLQANLGNLGSVRMTMS